MIRQLIAVEELSVHLRPRLCELGALLFLPHWLSDGRQAWTGDWKGGPGRRIAISMVDGSFLDLKTGATGDAFDLVARALTQDDRGAAVLFVRHFLGLDGDALMEDAYRQLRRRRKRIDEARLGTPTDDIEAAELREHAWRLWQAAGPIAGTPAENYQRGRGVDVAALGAAPLRFAPSVRHPDDDIGRPAMLSAITDQGGQFMAVVRTWLRVGDERVDLAALRKPMLPLGRIAAGAVRFGSPQAVRWIVGVAVEDAACLAARLPEAHVLAAVTARNARNVFIPMHVRDLTLVLPEYDSASREALDLHRAFNKWQRSAWLKPRLEYLRDLMSESEAP